MLKNHAVILSKKNSQGITLIEVMVALVIFAVLAVIGWQVFDSMNKAHQRTQKHDEQLTQLQFAYLQMQNDFNQAVAWQKKPRVNQSNEGQSANNTPATITPYFTLTQQKVEFVRFADPDPRYQTTPILSKVTYFIKDDQLLRKQTYQLVEVNSQLANNPAVDNLTGNTLLPSVDSVRFTALLPEPSLNFPSVQQSDANQQPSTGAEIKMLPKAVKVTFNYNDKPIEWLFALPDAYIEPINIEPANKPSAKPNSPK